MWVLGEVIWGTARGRTTVACLTWVSMVGLKVRGAL